MESCQRRLEFVLFFHTEARLPVFILSHALVSIPLLFLVYSLFVCVCACMRVCVYMCENVVPVDVTLTEKIEQLDFAQVWMQNGCCYKNGVCVCVCGMFVYLYAFYITCDMVI